MWDLRAWDRHEPKRLQGLQLLITADNCTATTNERVECYAPDCGDRISRNCMHLLRIVPQRSTSNVLDIRKAEAARSRDGPAAQDAPPSSSCTSSRAHEPSVGSCQALILTIALCVGGHLSDHTQAVAASSEQALCTNSFTRPGLALDKFLTITAASLLRKQYQSTVARRSFGERRNGYIRDALGASHPSHRVEIWPWCALLCYPVLPGIHVEDRHNTRKRLLIHSHACLSLKVCVV